MKQQNVKRIAQLVGCSKNYVSEILIAAHNNEPVPNTYVAKRVLEAKEKIEAMDKELEQEFGNDAKELEKAVEVFLIEQHNNGEWHGAYQKAAEKFCYSESYLRIKFPAKRIYQAAVDSIQQSKV